MMMSVGMISLTSPTGEARTGETVHYIKRELGGGHPAVGRWEGPDRREIGVGERSSQGLATEIGCGHQSLSCFIPFAVFFFVTEVGDAKLVFHIPAQPAEVY